MFISHKMNTSPAEPKNQQQKQYSWHMHITKYLIVGLYLFAGVLSYPYGFQMMWKRCVVFFKIVTDAGNFQESKSFRKCFA